MQTFGLKLLPLVALISLDREKDCNNEWQQSSSPLALFIFPTIHLIHNFRLQLKALETKF